MRRTKSVSLTDDELIVLWSLAGMELWVEYKNGIDNPFTIIHEMHTRMWYLGNAALPLFKEEDVRYVSVSNFGDDSRWETLCIIEDIITFNPDERWWKLLFAKIWYEKNKGQFNDG